MIDKLGLDGLGGASVRVEPAVVGLDPVAFMTHHDEPMLFPTWDEAVQYCDDDESPISLFHAADVAKLQAQLTAMTKKADGFFDALQLAAKINAEGQAREQQLREALEVCKKEMQGDKWDSLYIDGVLALPQDDTALMEWGANLLEEMAMEIDLGTQETEDAAITLCRKADELEAGK